MIVGRLKAPMTGTNRPVERPSFELIPLMNALASIERPRCVAHTVQRLTDELAIFNRQS